MRPNSPIAATIVFSYSPRSLRSSSSRLYAAAASHCGPHIARFVDPDVAAVFPNEHGLTYNRSDGLVKQAHAQLPGAPTSYGPGFPSTPSTSTRIGSTRTSTPMSSPPPIRKAWR